MASSLFIVAAPVVAPAPDLSLWVFDLVSAVIGAGIAILVFGLLRLLRQPFMAARNALVERAAQARSQLSASGEDRYSKAVERWADYATVAPELASLSSLFVEPELLTPVRPPESLAEVELGSQMYRELRLDMIAEGHPQLTIVGPPGCGRTALLAHLALAASRAESDAEGPGGDGTAGSGRVPLYVPLPVLDWEWIAENASAEQRGAEEAGGAAKDSWEVEALLAASLDAVGAKRVLAAVLRECLKEGRALVLADDWSELSARQQQLATGWLSRLAQLVPDNVWIVVTGTRGYAPLADEGFVPVRIAPWDAGRAGRLAARWAEAVQDDDLEGDLAQPSRLAAELQRAAQLGVLPFDLMLRAMVITRLGGAPSGRAALYDRAFELRLPEETPPWLRAACRDALSRIAQRMLDEGGSLVSWEEIELAVEDSLAHLEEWPSGALTEARTALIGPQAILRRVGPDLYCFAHPLWRLYLAARRLVDLGHDSLADRLEESRWDGVLSFCAGLADVASLIAGWLGSPDDLFQIRVRSVGEWIREAPADAAWTGGAMALLARSFLASRCPVSLRISLAEALAATETTGVGYLFRKAAEHADPEVRLAAVHGMTRMADVSDLPALTAALRDSHLAVREAAVLGLGRVGVGAARQLLEDLLIEQDDDSLRPAAAEALAKRGESDFLRKVAHSGDVAARRAAIFALARQGDRDAIHAMEEDSEWAVRSAVAAALEDLDWLETKGVEPPPDISQLPWLISWAATRGEGVGAGQAALASAKRAFAEGDITVRLAAAQVLARAGRPDSIETLQAALSDASPAVANAAFHALVEIADRHDVRVQRAAPKAEPPAGSQASQPLAAAQS
jgi:HEAT repeat protein